MVEDGPNNPGMELKLEWLEQVEFSKSQFKSLRIVRKFWLGSSELASCEEEGGEPCWSEDCQATVAGEKDSILMGGDSCENVEVFAVMNLQIDGVLKT